MALKRGRVSARASQTSVSVEVRPVLDLALAVGVVLHPLLAALELLVHVDAGLFHVVVVDAHELRVDGIAAQVAGPRRRRGRRQGLDVRRDAAREGRAGRGAFLEGRLGVSGEGGPVAARPVGAGPVRVLAAEALGDEGAEDEEDDDGRLGEDTGFE